MLTLLTSLGLGLGLAAPSHAQRAAQSFTDGTPEADAALAAQDWPAALQRLDARIAAQPNDVQASFKRATVLARMGRDQQAIAALRQIIERHPELPEPYNNLAALYARAGRLDDARSTLEDALRAHPGFTLAYRNLGDVYLRLAQAAYQRAGDDAVARGRTGEIERIVARNRAAPAARGTAASTPDAAQDDAAMGGTGRALLRGRP